MLSVASATVSVSQHQNGQHGKVDFQTSCAEEARHDFKTGLALLHHMMYDQAKISFERALEHDPDCAMAHWGIAMSVIHPLWGERPSDEDLRKGQTAVRHALNASGTTQRELDFAAAVAPFFENYETTTYAEQLGAFEKGFAALHEAYPEDVDAAAFYALGLLATAQKADTTLSHQKQAGSLLQRMHADAPAHPGLFHYTIHAYDHPRLAERALDVARAYDSIAPDVPHALHMPSHIFVRLGYWDDVIGWNERSAAAALRQPVGDATSMHYAHALDYLAYAHLQKGQDAEAARVGESIAAVRNFQTTFATAYALAAVPARLALERGYWEEAAALPLRQNEAFPWDRFPGAESITLFARGVGAARSGDIAAARESAQALERMTEHMKQVGEAYWATLAEAQRKTVEGWIALSEGDDDEALTLMREAADLEDSVDKHPVTPGAVLPARELLADMLMELDRPAEALEEYEASLALSANRLRSLAGAAKAADLAGNEPLARTYHARVADISAPGADRDVVTVSRRYLSDH